MVWESQHWVVGVVHGQSFGSRHLLYARLVCLCLILSLHSRCARVRSGYLVVDRPWCLYIGTCFRTRAALHREALPRIRVLLSLRVRVGVRILLRKLVKEVIYLNRLGCDCWRHSVGYGKESQSENLAGWKLIERIRSTHKSE